MKRFIGYTLVAVVLFGQLFSCHRHAPLVTVEPSKPTNSLCSFWRLCDISSDNEDSFRLDANFKLHHTAMLDGIRLLNLENINALNQTPGQPDSATVAFAAENGIDNLQLAVQEAVVDALAIRKRLHDNGYLVKILHGYTGSDLQEQDISTGFVYHQKSNTLLITLCGMDQPDDEPGVMDAELVPFAGADEKNNRLVHKGILARASKEFDQIVLPQFRAFWTRLTPMQKESLQIIVAGHSLGGGRAALHATFLTEQLATHEFYGSKFCGSNMLKAYIVSGLRVGNKEFADYVHALIGADNILNQGTSLDKGTVVQPGEGGYLGKDLLEAVSRYFDEGRCPMLGHYACDYMEDVYARGRCERLEDSIARLLDGVDEVDLAAIKVLLVSGPAHYVMLSSQLCSFAPTLVGGYGDPSYIEHYLLPQGQYMMNSLLGNVEYTFNNFVTIAGVTVGVL